jgi:hypothetical protein
VTATDRLFEVLWAYRQYPSYQLERRLDAFMAASARDLLLPRLGLSSTSLVIPEFPLPTFKDDKAGGDSHPVEDMRHRHADYLLADVAAGKVALVEFKTSSKSARSDPQFKSYEYFEKWPELHNFAVGIATVRKSGTTPRARFGQLFADLAVCAPSKMLGAQGESRDIAIDRVLLAPKKACDNHARPMAWTLVPLRTLGDRVISGKNEDPQWAEMRAAFLKMLSRIDLAERA